MEGQDDTETDDKQAPQTQAEEKATKSTPEATEQETTQKASGDTTYACTNAREASKGHRQETTYTQQAVRQNKVEKSHEEKTATNTGAETPTRNQWIQASQQDAEIQEISNYIQDGWPAKVGENANRLRGYWGEKDNLYVADSILWNAQMMVVPRSMRSQIKNMASKLKDKENNHTRIEERFWWPYRDRDMADANSQAKKQTERSKEEEDHKTDKESTADQMQSWHTISLDIINVADTGEEGTVNAIIIEDVYSAWPEVKLVSKITTQIMITLLKELFSREGIPHTIQIGGDISFRSKEMEQFIATHGIKVQQVERRNQVSNGTTETLRRRLIDRIRAAVHNGREWRTEVRNELCNIRSTTVQGKDVTPFQLMRGRQATALRGPAET